MPFLIKVTCNGTLKLQRQALVFLWHLFSTGHLPLQQEQLVCCSGNLDNPVKKAQKIKIIADLIRIFRPDFI